MDLCDKELAEALRFAATVIQSYMRKYLIESSSLSSEKVRNLQPSPNRKKLEEGSSTFSDSSSDQVRWDLISSGLQSPPKKAVKVPSQHQYSVLNARMRSPSCQLDRHLRMHYPIQATLPPSSALSRRLRSLVEFSRRRVSDPALSASVTEEKKDSFYRASEGISLRDVLDAADSLTATVQDLCFDDEALVGGAENVSFKALERCAFSIAEYAMRGDVSAEMTSSEASISITMSMGRASLETVSSLTQPRSSSEDQSTCWQSKSGIASISPSFASSVDTAVISEPVLTHFLIGGEAYSEYSYGDHSETLLSIQPKPDLVDERMGGNLEHEAVIPVEMHCAREITASAAIQMCFRRHRHRVRVEQRRIEAASRKEAGRKILSYLLRFVAKKRAPSILSEYISRQILLACEHRRELLVVQKAIDQRRSRRKGKHSPRKHRALIREEI